MSKEKVLSKGMKYEAVWSKTLLTLAMCVVVVATALAQPKDNAPYSRIGLGEPVNHSLSTMGYGGLTAAFVDPLHINYLNPASHSWLSATAFEAGAYYDRSKLEFDGQTTKVLSGNLTHLALAFPMRNPLNDVLEKKERKWFWGMGVALIPNTSVGYDIRTENVLPEVDTVLNIFQGTGGTNKFIWGNSWRYKNFSFGVNLMYLFGTLDSERRVQFNSLEASYDDVFYDNISLRAFQWSLGAQYRHTLWQNPENARDVKTLVIGLYGNPSSGFTTKNEILRLRENFTYSPPQTDTLLAADGVKQKGNLPAEFTLGVMYEDAQKLKLGLEYSYGNWSQYENEAKPETLYNSYRVAVGAQYSPNASSYNNYWQRVRYRAGFYFGKDPRLEDLKRSALTLGLGLPVILPRQQTSFVNIGVEIGRLNTDNGIKENFVKIALGFTLNDTSWFFKRKFG
ncbi:MAG: hypothetical protein D6816_14965 [Bacteroidetes bacterium]|nr:MAG: hypothetical protein D6816_14965 [Bacteroidota bacterium]